MNINASQIVNLSMALAGPMAVILIRFVGQGAAPAAAQVAPKPADTPIAQMLASVQSSPVLLDAWEASIESFERAPAVKVVIAPPNAEDPMDNTSVQILPPRPRLVLTSILAEGTSGSAVLNNRIYRVGSDMGGGWVLETIDNHSRTVTLRHRSGAIHVIEIDDGG